MKGANLFDLIMILYSFGSIVSFFGLESEGEPFGSLFLYVQGLISYENLLYFIFY